MTGPERSELHALREDIRDFREEINDKLDRLGDRTASLEKTRDRAEGAADSQQRSAERVTQERRWRVGLVAGVLASVGIGLLNFLRVM